jgi:hypothetical protein
MERWRAFAWIGFLVVTWAGCSGKSNHGGDAPQDMAGQGGGAGKGSSADKGGSAGAGASAGSGAQGAGEEGGSGDTNLGGASAAGRGGTGMGAFAGSGTGGVVAAGAGGSSAGNGGVAGNRTVPIEWGCARSTFGDGVCDCGCGALDVDCSKADLDVCENCNLLGSCNRDECPGRIDPDDITTCLAPPKEWICSPAAYGDGKVCDCGCGAQDLDCPNSKLASCDSCQTVGSCSFSACPGKLTPDDNSTCYVPPAWTCDPFYYGDGECTCGCGVVDVDCPDRKASSCVNCPSTCVGPNCSGIVADDNAYCTNPPATWNCAQRLYHDGSVCDCGCGDVDPDCTGGGIDTCDKCDSPGSCSVLACPGLIDTEQNSRCTRPQPPEGWLCYQGLYGDAYCDCGCGVIDIDCLGTSADLCEHCGRCSGDCQNLDPADPLQCKPAPSGWTCNEEHYFDYQCDCGCGILDPWCNTSTDLYACTEFPEEGCSGGNKSLIDRMHNERCTVTIPSAWKCVRAYYDDGVCDCGCGVADPDCSSKLVGACGNCSDNGGCSTTSCPGSINATDNTRCGN